MDATKVRARYALTKGVFYVLLVVAAVAFLVNAATSTDARLYFAFLTIIALVSFAFAAAGLANSLGRGGGYWWLFIVFAAPIAPPIAYYVLRKNAQEVLRRGC